MLDGRGVAKLSEYLPKIFQELHDVFGRCWALGTLQYQFSEVRQLCDHHAAAFACKTMAGSSRHRSPFGQADPNFAGLCYQQSEVWDLHDFEANALGLFRVLEHAYLQHEDDLISKRETKEMGAYLKDYTANACLSYKKVSGLPMMFCVPRRNSTLRGYGQPPAMHVLAHVIQLFLTLLSKHVLTNNTGVRGELMRILASVLRKAPLGHLASNASSLRLAADKAGADGKVSYEFRANKNPSVRAWWFLLPFSLREIIKQNYSSGERTPEKRLALRLHSFLVGVGVTSLALVFEETKKIQARANADRGQDCNAGQSETQESAAKKTRTREEPEAPRVGPAFAKHSLTDCVTNNQYFAALSPMVQLDEKYRNPLAPKLEEVGERSLQTRQNIASVIKGGQRQEQRLMLVQREKMARDLAGGTTKSMHSKHSKYGALPLLDVLVFPCFVNQDVVRQRTGAAYINGFNQSLKIVAPNYRAFVRTLSGHRELLKRFWTFPSHPGVMFFHLQKADGSAEYVPTTPKVCTVCDSAVSIMHCKHGSLCADCQSSSCANAPQHHQAVNLLVLCACGSCEAEVLSGLSVAIGAIKASATSAKRAKLANNSWCRSLWLTAKGKLLSGGPANNYRRTDEVRERAKQELRIQITRILACIKPSKADRFKLALYRRRLRKVLWNCHEQTSLPPTPASHKRRFTNVEPCTCKSTCTSRCGCRSSGRACGELCHGADPCRCTNMGEAGEHCWSSDDEGKDPTAQDISKWIWTL